MNLNAKSLHALNAYGNGLIQQHHHGLNSLYHPALIELNMKQFVKNYEGYFFGFLLVRVDLWMQPNKTSGVRYRKVLAQCTNCDQNIKSYNIHNLKSGATTSCGCVHKKILSDYSTKHGLSKKASYKIWIRIKSRCFNNKNKDYKHYGARGIKVCDAWKDSFEQFYNDMGERPKGMEIDRIDNNGDYEPTNCRWTSRSINVFNQRKRVTNTSGKTGVVWSKQKNQWEAKICVNQKVIRLGFFESFDSAVEKRKQAEMQFFGSNRD